MAPFNDAWFQEPEVFGAEINTKIGMLCFKLNRKPRAVAPHRTDGCCANDAIDDDRVRLGQLSWARGGHGMVVNFQL